MPKPILKHDHPYPIGYTQERRYWFRRCDDCGKRGFGILLHECYPPLGADHGWWYGCPTCVKKDTRLDRSGTCDGCGRLCIAADDYSTLGVYNCARCPGWLFCSYDALRHFVRAIHLRDPNPGQQGCPVHGHIAATAPSCSGCYQFMGGAPWNAPRPSTTRMATQAEEDEIAAELGRYFDAEDN